MQQSSSAVSNVILFGTDGLNAADMSVYGYDRDTTPFITNLAQSSLLSQNNFSNAGSSQGSDTATLTGKLPLTTRVLFAPDILQGTDEYQHLPGILKSAGYRTVFLGEKYYDDVNSTIFKALSILYNCDRELRSTPFPACSPVMGLTKIFTFYPASKAGSPIDLTHIFFIKDMVNPFTG